MWPLPLAVSAALPSSHQTTSRPSCWNWGLDSSGAMLFCSHWSAVESLIESEQLPPPGQSSLSLTALGTTKEKLGSEFPETSPANCEKGTILLARDDPPRLSVMYANGL